MGKSDDKLVDQLLTEPTEQAFLNYELSRKIDYSKFSFNKNPLGAGSSGAVYLATYNHKEVAVKIFYPRKDLKPERQKKSICYEAALMEVVRSEYVVELLGVCFEPHYCLVMEYCEKGTLYAYLREPIQFPDIKLLWAEQISRALCLLHEKGILHRDLKTVNIFINDEENAKLGDFGLSITVALASKQPALSSLLSKAPELFEKKPNSKKTDIYALGMVLWELVTGKSPFEKLLSDEEKIKEKVLKGEREELPANCPKVFECMIQACWHQEPDKRPTAQQVCDQFSAAYRAYKSIINLSQPPSKKDKPRPILGKNSFIILSEKKPKEKKVDPLQQRQRDCTLL
jgi:serine/threonine protein kinase